MATPATHWAPFLVARVAIASILIPTRIHASLMDGPSFQNTTLTARPHSWCILYNASVVFFYVGKTIQKLCKRLYRHIAAMKSKDPDSPWGRHIALMHNERLPKISVLVLDRIHQTFRGGDSNKLLLQREMRWIANLNATSPPGLNEILSYKPFLQGFTSGGYEGNL